MAPAKNVNPPRVLIVDDDPDNLLILETRLKEKGCVVYATSSGEKAIQTARAERPDAIVLDILMPEMDGTQLCSRLRALPETQSIPVFFLTCLQSKEEEVKEGQVGATRIFAKPVDIDRLYKKIKEVTES